MTAPAYFISGVTSIKAIKGTFYIDAISAGEVFRLAVTPHAMSQLVEIGKREIVRWDSDRPSAPIPFPTKKQRRKDARS